MADWTAPFHMPEMEDDQFKKRRKKKIKDDGYVVKIPGLEDIVKIPVEEPLSAQERTNYKYKYQGEISDERWAEINRMEATRRERYQAMLQNPTPDILRSHSSIMTAIDDAQDALSTLFVLGRLLLPILPAAAAEIVAGPLGWILAAATLLNLMNQLGAPNPIPMHRKRKMEAVSKNNPFTKKGRSGIAKALKKRGLHSGNIIEGLQVTKDLFGFGLCLGPIMGLVTSIPSGLVRQAMGQKVKWEGPSYNQAHWEAVGDKFLHSAGALFGDDPVYTDNECTAYMIAYHFAQQLANARIEPYPPHTTVESIKTIEFRAPSPTNPITRRVIEEAGNDPDDHVAWPTTGEKWSNINTLFDATHPKVNQNMSDMYQRNAHNLQGYYTGAYASETALYSLENVGGKQSVETGYTIPNRAVWGLLRHNWTFPDDVTPRQIQGLAKDLEDLEAQDYDFGKEGIVAKVRDIARRRHDLEFIQYSG